MGASEFNVRGCDFLGHRDEIKPNCVTLTLSSHASEDQDLLLLGPEGWCNMFY